MTTFFVEPKFAQPADIRNPQYQALKGQIHQELLGRLNLERLGRVDRVDAEPEIRSLILGLLERESQTTPLSLFERDCLITSAKASSKRAMSFFKTMRTSSASSSGSSAWSGGASTNPARWSTLACRTVRASTP